MRERMAKHVESGAVPGLVALIARGGDVEVVALGDAHRETVFRITSMTKPITAAAAMLLVEEGRLKLDEPVDALLPELANRKVLRRIDGPLDDTVPARRAITTRDLLRFTMGFGIIWGPPNATPIQRAAEDLKLGAFGPPKPLEPPPPDEWMRRFSTLPLMCQPGEQWQYNTGAEVLGVLIARAAKTPFDVFLHERIFEPLGMKQTAFWSPRLPMSYLAQDGKLAPYDPPDGQWSRPPAFPSGGAGLVSTVDDYFAFARMLLDGGLLKRESVAAMTSDQLTPAIKAASPVMPADYWRDHGWGFGMSVRSDGRYGWDGGLGTSWYTDPAKGRLAILMTQRAEFPAFSPVWRDFWAAVF